MYQNPMGGISCEQVYTCFKAAPGPVGLGGAGVGGGFDILGG